MSALRASLGRLGLPAFDHMTLPVSLSGLAAMSRPGAASPLIDTGMGQPSGSGGEEGNGGEFGSLTLRLLATPRDALPPTAASSLAGSGGGGGGAAWHAFLLLAEREYLERPAFSGVSGSSIGDAAGGGSAADAGLGGAARVRLQLLRSVGVAPVTIRQSTLLTLLGDPDRCDAYVRSQLTACA